MHAKRDDLNAYHRNYHAQLRARGICVTCLRPSEKYWRCLRCRKRQAKRKNKAYIPGTRHGTRMSISPAENGASLPTSGVSAIADSRGDAA